LQAQVLSWDAYIFSDAFLPVAEALRNRSEAFKDRAVPGPGRVSQIPELEARGRQRVQLFWQYLDEYLDGREYLVGNAITMADIDAFVVVDFAGWIKERVPESRSRVDLPRFGGRVVESIYSGVLMLLLRFALGFSVPGFLSVGTSNAVCRVSGRSFAVC
jgi:glutathione S-transferase